MVHSVFSSNACSTAVLLSHRKSLSVLLALPLSLVYPRLCLILLIPLIYWAIVNYLGDKKLVYFRNGHRYKHDAT